MTPSFKPVADHALLVNFASEFSEEANVEVRKLDAAIAGAQISGVLETVPAFVNLLISFDPVITDHNSVEQAVHRLLESMADVAVQPSKQVVQVCYEDEFAPDLAAVAQACGLTKDAVINAHLSGDFHVVMYGFAPGYAYMGGVPPEIQVPRKPAPVRDIATGSILIAGAQCLVTTLVMPTGWSIIGRSPTKILLDEPDRPFLFEVGDKVSFERIDRAAFDALARETADA